MLSTILLEILMYVGVAACSISGTFHGINHRMDLFGVAFLAETTAFAGGIMRDLLLGCIPVRAFSDTSFYMLELEVLVLSLVFFFIAKKMQNQFLRVEKQLDQILNVVDAIAVSLYAVSGTELAMLSGFQENGFFCVFLGTLTAVGGGAMRDLFMLEVPMIFKKRIYALAALAGSISYYLVAYLLELPILAAILGFLVTFLLRMLSTIFKWQLPVAIQEDLN